MNFEPEHRPQPNRSTVKIAILSCSPKSYSTRRLKEAALTRGHHVRVLNTLRFAIDLDKGSPHLFYRGKSLSTYDVVIPRIGASITYFGTAVVRQFEQMDVFVHANGCQRNHQLAGQVALACRSSRRHQIGIPQTDVRASNRDDVMSGDRESGWRADHHQAARGHPGGGSHPRGQRSRSPRRSSRRMQSTRQNVLIQKFVAESRGKDIRAFVVGDRVVGAMRRVAQGGEFRSNVHRGGSTERVELDEAYEQAAVRAAQIMNLQVAGVDMLESSSGPQIMEVNSSPGLEGIEGATKLDIAGAIIDYAQEHVRFPELDIRQRLTVSRGYGVSELHIPEGSPFVGKTIAESGLRESDIVVLALHRGTTVIPNPRESRVLEGGDRLLAFGKRESMKSLVPERRSRLKKRKLKKLPVGNPGWPGQAPE